VKLDEVLQRLDRWLGKREWLAAPASAKGIAKAEKALGVSLPSALRALYERHDGET